MGGCEAGPLDEGGGAAHLDGRNVVGVGRQAAPRGLRGAAALAAAAPAAAAAAARGRRPAGGADAHLGRAGRGPRYSGRL
jgi:hypothetical protein